MEHVTRMFAAAEGYGYPISLATTLPRPLRARARISAEYGTVNEQPPWISRRSRRSIDPSVLDSEDHCNIVRDRRILSRREGTDSREARRGGLCPRDARGARLYLVRSLDPV